MCHLKRILSWWWYQRQPWCTDEVEGQRQRCGKKTCSGFLEKTQISGTVSPPPGGKDFQIDLGRDPADPEHCWEGKVPSVTSWDRFQQWCRCCIISDCEKWNQRETFLQLQSPRTIRREVESWAWNLFLLLLLAEDRKTVIVIFLNIAFKWVKSLSKTFFNLLLI